MGSRREHTSGTVGGIEVTLGGAFGNITPPPPPQDASASVQGVWLSGVGWDDLPQLPGHYTESGITASQMGGLLMSVYLGRW